MGPQHPSTHGVLRVILKTRWRNCHRSRLRHRLPASRHGEDCRESHVHDDRSLLGSSRLHRGGFERTGLGRNGGADDGSRMCRHALTTYERFLLSSIASRHTLLWLATHALDIGAVTILLWAFREREEILKIFERQFGARLTCHAWRVGGMPNDAYDDFSQRRSPVRQQLSEAP